MTIAQLHQLFVQHSVVLTDTRKITPGGIFFALKGESFDANTFTEQAIQQGASYVVLDNLQYHNPNSSQYILVSNVLLTLQQLAQYHRKYLNIPIIALTGSNGKTTTKELIFSVLSQKFKTQATLGNLNNHIGVPLTLLSFNQNTEIGIVEMGANHQKEIAFLCEIAQPDYGYITNFGKAHLEGFGGVEGIIKGKSELYTYLQANQKMAFVNLDETLQQQKTETLQRYTFSTQHSQADVSLSNIIANPMVKLQYNHTDIQSNLIGLYNATNIAAAVCIGNYFKLSTTQIKQGIEQYIPSNNRSQIIQKNTNQIILDAYNANPSSMKAALDNFAQISGSKTAFLGDMFELGNESSMEHQYIVQLCQTLTSIEFYFIGSQFFAHQTNTSNMQFFESFESFEKSFTNQNITNNTILIKGSRGMALERIIVEFFSE